MVACKQRDLKNKSPIFNLYSETITGLIQIKILNKRKKLIQDLSNIINNCIKSSVSFDMVSRGFGFTASVIGLCLMCIGLMIGIRKVNQDNFGLYGVTIIFLLGFSEYLQWFLRQMVSTESLMLSSERSFQIINL
jgi:ATP-binding cassette subfamily C (CFTR/MRP) protein 4